MAGPPTQEPLNDQAKITDNATSREGLLGERRTVVVWKCERVTLPVTSATSLREEYTSMPNVLCGFHSELRPCNQQHAVVLRCGRSQLCAKPVGASEMRCLPP
jgi:hypothetical protein